eukprot:543436_1
MLLGVEGNLNIANTTNVFGHSYSSPFTNESSISFKAKYKVIEAKQDVEKCGKYKCKTDLVTNFSSYAEVLDIEGKLGGNFGVVGAEAEVKFFNNKHMTSNDLRMIMQSSYEANSIKNMDLWSLRLNDSSMRGIKTFTDFKNKWGSHIVVGFQYGAKSTHMLTYKWSENINQEEFKLKVWGKLTAFGLFTIAKAKVVDINTCSHKKKVDIKCDYSKTYFPQNVEFTDDNKLMDEIDESFNSLCDFQNQHADTQMINKLKQNIFKLICTNCKPINVILMPIKCIPCVHDKFIKTETLFNQIQLNLQAFSYFINPLYYTLKEIEHDLNHTKNNIVMNQVDYGFDNKLIDVWSDQLSKKLKQIEAINKEKHIIELMDRRNKYLSNHENKNMDLLEVTKETHQINKAILKMQFQQQIMNKCNLKH